MKKSFFVELAIVCFFAAAVFACFMGTAATVSAHIVFGVAALVSGAVFVGSLIEEARMLGMKA
ncbi:MAG: hypothetical protein MSM72_02670 [Firmicutes bacterium]|nr:hypothetical protein [Bacillota bacterium]